jgi:hypothetical protein
MDDVFFEPQSVRQRLFALWASFCAIEDAHPAQHAACP